MTPLGSYELFNAHYLSLLLQIFFLLFACLVYPAVLVWRTRFKSLDFVYFAYRFSDDCLGIGGASLI